MTGRFYSLLLGASLLATPALAQNTSTQNPTADSAASQVGKTSHSTLDENGKQVEPSHKLKANPLTEAEQPGTQPPPNDKPAKTTKQPLAGPYHYQPEKYKGANDADHKTTPAQTEKQP